MFLSIKLDIIFKKFIQGLLIWCTFVDTSAGLRDFLFLVLTTHAFNWFLVFTNILYVTLKSNEKDFPTISSCYVLAIKIKHVQQIIVKNVLKPFLK